MTRVQIQLEASQIDGLRERSAETGRSIADLVREGVDLYLNSKRRPSRDELIRRALKASGKYSSGKGDISRRHDVYLADAYRA